MIILKDCEGAFTTLPVSLEVKKRCLRKTRTKMKTGTKKKTLKRKSGS